MTRFLYATMFPMIKWFGEPGKIVQAHMFIKNNQAMTKYDFKETFEGIRDFLDGKGVGYGILLTMDGTYVFTDKKIKFDELIVKLSVGVNYCGVVKRAKADLEAINIFRGAKT